MFRVCVLGSGSGGNCTAVWTDKTRILIDAGLHPRRVMGEVERLGFPRIDAILITHAHGDHFGHHTYKLASECGIPVHCNHTTWRVAKGRCGELEELEQTRPKLVQFFDGESFAVGDLQVTPFKVPHKGLGQGNGNGHKHAGLPVGFAIAHRRQRRTYVLGYATDLGHVPDEVIAHLTGADVLVIESNHCEQMVDERGAFHGPWVKSDHGHLNNLDAGRAIVRIAGERSRAHKPLQVMLAHISQDHNTEKTALSQVTAILNESDVTLAGLYLTYQDKRSRVIDIVDS